tara:strand:- start:1374 stop:1682 length:309 start_codon:yes stop_codon:yes gene_type:complete
MRVNVQFCRCRESCEEREGDQGYYPSNGGASSENMRLTNRHLGNSSFYWPIEATSRFGKGGKIDLAQVVGSGPIVVEAFLIERIITRTIIILIIMPKTSQRK